MEYINFYEISEYGSDAWKGNFSNKEMACNAYEYMTEFLASKESGEPTETIKELYKLLIDDGSEECIDWAYQIANELNLIDMDYMDYTGTDTKILRKIIERGDINA